MASSSKDWPPHPSYESSGLGDDVSPPKEHRAARTEEHQAARPTITAIRIPTNKHILPYMITLELVKATSDYHLNLHDTNLLHCSNDGDMRNQHRHSSQLVNAIADDDQSDALLDQVADDAQINLPKLYDSTASVYERVHLPHNSQHRLNAHSYSNGIGTFLDVPLAEKTEKPHLTFTHASLRLQPNVVGRFWRSGEAWNQRMFQRLYAVPREEADLEMLTGEYHIMYTHAVGRGLPPNEWAIGRIFGDAFVLKMASGKNDEGDWYYENMPQEILHSSLGNQCLETLRSVRPITWKIMVGERGDGLPGVVSAGTGLRGTVTRFCVA